MLQIALAFFITVLPITASGAEAELITDVQGVLRAEVMRIVESREEIVPGTEVPAMIQTIEARILEGERRGEIVTFENDYLKLEKGDKFFMNFLLSDGIELYSVREVDRRASIFMLVGLFAAVILVFGGLQGFRSLVALSASLLVIVYILMPLLARGLAPVPVAIGVGTIILALAIFLTHGFNRFSAVAFAGTTIAVIITGVLGAVSVELTKLTGFATDEAIYLNLSTAGDLNFVGLLLGAIIIGSLGVLDDIAITQVAVVRELYSLEQSISKREAFTRALRVGRDHVSALVNTLVLAYTGAALPLILLFSLSDASALSIINREVFASEIVRTIIGSIGLISTVPITTAIAAFYLDKHQRGTGADNLHGHPH